MERDILLMGERQAADIADFDRIVDLHRKQVYGLAYQLTGSHEDADDISQEVFIRAYKSIRKFRGRAKLSTWLYRITVNLSINHLKKKPGHKHTDEGIFSAGVDPVVPDWSSNPLQDVEAEELAQGIRMATESLPAKERVVFILRVNQELSYKEIARALDCPVGTVMSRLNRARRRLRDKLRDYIV
jgi:RNA polymerase sigma-70 factor (ECF subfamily)